MGKRNRMQQPYGYREQNQYLSELAMICTAIEDGGGGSGSSYVEKIIKEILYTAFFDVEYNRAKKAFVFKNDKDEEVASAKLADIIVSDLVKSAAYDAESKKIVFTFDNNDVVEVPLDDLVELIEQEKAERENADAEIWEAISGFTSGETIIEMIEQEIAERISGDTALEEALEQEIEDRISGDTALEEAIEEEAEERISADTALQEALEQEIAERISADTALEEALEQEREERISADTALEEALEVETEERISADTALQEAIDQEREERISADTELQEAIDNETAERISADTALQEALEQETAERISANTELQEAIDNEAAIRESADTTLQEALEQEIAERISGDTALQEALDNEAAIRESADTELQEAIDNEAAIRESADTELQEAIDNEAAIRESADTAEATARENADALLQTAIDEEAAAREAADNALEDEIEANKVKIEKITTGLEANVREAYKLTNTSGEQLGETINVYKDSSLKDVELTDHDDRGRSGQFLKFTYILEDGTEKEEYLDVSVLLIEAEFKDGLKVNELGEVSVKIDASSEEYLTVSSAGLKVSGIDAIKSDLELEKLTRESKDTLLEGAIATETADRMAADNGIRLEIANEATARESGDAALQTAINNEAATRETNDNALDLKIEREKTARDNADQSLNRYITQVNSDLSTEVGNRVSGDANLQSQINTLATADVEINSKILNLQTALSNETSAREAADTALQNALVYKADAEDVYYKDEADAKFATKEEIPTDFYTKAEVDGKIDEVNDSIADEATERENADAALNSAITAETQAREDADDALDARVTALENGLDTKLEAVTPKNMSISVDNTDATRPALSVNISADSDQIIKLNADGLYAKATLEYDESNNELTFTNTTSSTSIKLKTQSQIDNIYYDKPNEEIVIEYTVNGQRMTDVRVPVGDLIDEWRPEDGNVGAVALTKTRNVSGEDVLSARLVLNDTHTDNMATIDANALYVSKNAIISGLTSQLTALEARVRALENRNTTNSTNSSSQQTHSSNNSSNSSEDDYNSGILDGD